MDDYWKKIGEEIERKKQEAARIKAEHANPQLKKLRLKQAPNPTKRSNKRPK